MNINFQFCVQEGGIEGYKLVLEKLLPTCRRELEFEKAEVIILLYIIIYIFILKF